MAQDIIQLTVLEVGSKALPRPVIVYVPASQITDIDTSESNSLNYVRVAGERLGVAEHPLDIEALRDFTNTDGLVVQRVAAGVAALGAAQGDGYDVIKYLTEVDTATADSADGIDLPAATVGALYTIINNHATVELQIFPLSGDFIDPEAVDTEVALAVGDKITFYCEVADHWTVVQDNA